MNQDFFFERVYIYSGCRVLLFCVNVYRASAGVERQFRGKLYVRVYMVYFDSPERGVSKIIQYLFDGNVTLKNSDRQFGLLNS